MTGAWYPHTRDPGWTAPPPSPEALTFHRSLPDYAPTPLVEVPALARQLDVGRVLVKDESTRLGLPAFKALGASWAVHRALHGRRGPCTFVAATDGNHGRAVAEFARRAGHSARILVPADVPDGARQAIAAAGAEVTVTDGSYDEAVKAAAALAASEDVVLVQDTAWDGYTDVPAAIVEGYETLFAEIDDELPAPGLVVVPVGVGSLLQAALTHYRAEGHRGRTAVVSVEAQAAACVAVSLRAGNPVVVPTRSTPMTGLNCGTLSPLAWPAVRHGLDGAVSVTDAQDLAAARDLRDLGVDAGPCGAAGLAAARIALTGPGSGTRRRHLGVGPDSTVVLLSTEGSGANPVAAPPTLTAE